MSEQKSVGSEIYGGAADFGRVMAVVGVVFGTIIGIGLIIGGIIMVLKKSKRTAKVTATITNDPNCVQHTEGKDTTLWNCTSIDVQYTIGGSKHSKTISVDSSNKYTKGNDITLYYDPNNPSNISASSDNTHVAGWVCLGIGIFMIISSWIWLWLTRRYKFAAAAGGVSTVVDLLRH